MQASVFILQTQACMDWLENREIRKRNSLLVVFSLIYPLYVHEATVPKEESGAVGVVSLVQKKKFWTRFLD
jgi:hypothetical protein